MRRGKARDTGPTPAVRHLVYKRANWCCEKCGRSALYRAEVHHRKPRRMGGTSDPAINLPSNLVLLCGDCHREIESHRLTAASQGWLIGSQSDPALTPIRTKGYGYVYLDPDGSYRPAEQEDAHE